MTMLTFVGFLFVDDTDLMITTKSADGTSRGLIDEVQRTLDAWEGYLRATGGALVPSNAFGISLTSPGRDLNGSIVTSKTSQETY